MASREELEAMGITEDIKKEAPKNQQEKKVGISKQMKFEKYKTIKKKLNFKMIFVVIIVIIALVGFIGYYYLNIKSKESTAEKFIADEKKEEISSLIYKLRPTKDYEYPTKYQSVDDLLYYRDSNTFEDWIESLRKLKNDNLFAQKAIEIIDKTNYYDLEEYEKMYLDYYIKYNFFDLYSTWNDDKNMECIEAYIVSFESEEPCYLSQLYFKIDSYNANTYKKISLYKPADGSKKRMTEGFLEREPIYDGEEFYFYNEDNVAKAKSVDENKLNNLIVEYKELIDFMRDYSKECYLPIMEANYKKDQEDYQRKKEEQKKAQEEEERLKNSIPKVGMTSEEVKKTKWGAPDKINKDTYSWGTTEQWVYNIRGYVYLKNGVVTSVSER